MKYEVVTTSKFEKELSKVIKQGKDISKLNEIVNLLSAGEELPISNRDHKLIGNYKGFRECHIEPNWLLIYKIDDSMLVLSLTRTGSHSELLMK